MSAAGAVATALAVGAVADRAPRESIEVAHLADLFGGGGLGGVAAIVGGGGLEFRRSAGVPPVGQTTHLPLAGTLLVGTAGRAMPSPPLLRDPRFLRRVRVASRGLDELLRTPSPSAFFELSEQFTDRLGLAPASLRDLLRQIRGQGAWASQAMLGRSFFVRPHRRADRDAVLDLLERHGVHAVELTAARHGARTGPAARPAAAQPF
jgi:pantoate kinase